MYDSLLDTLSSLLFYGLAVLSESLFIGVGIIFPIFPKLIKRKPFIFNLTIWLLSGFVASLIGIGLHPAFLPLPAYLVGISLSFYGPLKSDRIWIWKKIFLVSATAIALTWIVFQAQYSFLQFQAKSRESEVKTNLSSIATAEISYFDDFKNFGNFSQIGWEPFGINRYSYYLSENDALDTVFESSRKEYITNVKWDIRREYPAFIRYHKFNTPIPEKEVLKSTAKKYGIGITGDNFTAVAIGNIDRDPDWDVWIINKDKRLKRVQNDRHYRPGAQTKLNLLVAEIYDDGFVILPDRIALVMVIFNLLLWLLFSLLARKYERRITLT